MTPMTNRVKFWIYINSLTIETNNFAFDIKVILGLESTHLGCQMTKIEFFVLVLLFSLANFYYFFFHLIFNLFESSFFICCLSFVVWFLVLCGWMLDVGGWKLQAKCWRLEARRLQLEIVGCLNCCCYYFHFTFHLLSIICNLLLFVISLLVFFCIYYLILCNFIFLIYLLLDFCGWRLEGGCWRLGVRG